MGKVINWEQNIDLIDTIYANYEDDLSKAIVNIVLLFNAFESQTQWYKYTKHYHLKTEYYFDIFEKFRKRYVTDGKINENFNNLFRDNVRPYENQEGNHEEENRLRVIDTLLGNTDNNEDKLFTCLCLSYRFRNNIFHGKKHIAELQDYLECYGWIIDLFKNILKYSDYKHRFYR